MRHDSRYGTTCWICGHPGLRGKRIDGVTYQSCDDCVLAKGSLEDIQWKRNADVEGLSATMEGKDYWPVYWVPARFDWVLSDNQGVPREILAKLKCIPYFDAYWEASKARINSKRSEARRTFYAEVRKQKKEEKLRG